MVGLLLVVVEGFGRRGAWPEGLPPAAGYRRVVGAQIRTWLITLAFASLAMYCCISLQQ
jgi:hypothetical protein